MLTKYGTNNIIVMLLISAALIASSYIIENIWIAYPAAAAGFLLALFTFWFFRDPPRATPDWALADNSYIIAPADGRIIEIKNVSEPRYMKAECIRISIFLSPLDVHVNRSPVSGVVDFFEYRRGRFLAAYKHGASSQNEQTYIGVKNSCGKVLFKQIVGVLARRLAWDIETGDSISAGQKFGMMKFGSRMDIFLDKNSDLSCKAGQKTIAGETILGRMPINQNSRDK